MMQRCHDPWLHAVPHQRARAARAAENEIGARDEDPAETNKPSSRNVHATMMQGWCDLQRQRLSMSAWISLDVGHVASK